MSPSRLFRPLQVGFANVDTGPSVGAGLLTLFSAFWNLHVVVLCLFVIGANILDLLTGARRARIYKRLGLPGAYDRAVLDDGILDKAIVFVVILFAGVSIDSILTLAASPADLPVSRFFQTFTPTLTALLAHRFARELTSAIENVEDTPGGRDAIWPGARKIIDAIRYRLMTSGSPPMPERRWDDHLSAEKRARIEVILGEADAPADSELP